MSLQMVIPSTLNSMTRDDGNRGQQHQRSLTQILKPAVGSWLSSEDFLVSFFIALPVIIEVIFVAFIVFLCCLSPSEHKVAYLTLPPLPPHFGPKRNLQGRLGGQSGACPNTIPEWRFELRFPKWGCTILFWSTNSILGVPLDRYIHLNVATLGERPKVEDFVAQHRPRSS